MNNKRQTIWLVSMLSLMVILSAYYLFTEDAPSQKQASGDNASLTEDAGQVSSADPNGIQITQVDSMTDEIQGIEGGEEAGAPASEGALGADGEAGTPPEDQEVIKGIANAAGNELLEQQAYDQRFKISKRAEELSAIVSNTKSSQEDAAAAAEELDRLSDMDARITSLQEKLVQDYENAVVTEESDNFKVIVLSDKLDKKTAIGILDLATKELDVEPSQVTVQYVQ